MLRVNEKQETRFLTAPATKSICHLLLHLHARLLSCRPPAFGPLH